MSVGNRLQSERKRLGLSQEDFAKQMGVSLSSQKRYETGEREPAATYLDKLDTIGADSIYVLSGRTPADRERADLRDFREELGFWGQAFAHALGIDEADIKRTRDGIRRDVLPLYDELETLPYQLHSSKLDAIDAERKKLIQTAVDGLLADAMYRPDAKVLALNSGLLEQAIMALDAELTRHSQSLSAVAKARATLLLYRHGVSSGKVDQRMAADVVTLLGSV